MDAHGIQEPIDQILKILISLVPIIISILGLIYYLERRPDQIVEDPTVRKPLDRAEKEELRTTYVSLHSERLVRLFFEFGLKEDARQLVFQELQNRGVRVHYLSG